MTFEYTRDAQTGLVMQSKSDQVRQDLEKTFDILEEHGWCQGSSSDNLGPEGSVCLEEAMAMATMDVCTWGHVKVEVKRDGIYRWYMNDPQGLLGRIYVDADKARRYSEAYHTLHSELLDSPGYVGHLFHWNDDMTRTVDEVKDLIRKGIKAHT